jgi:hypothetical protein
MRIHYSKGHRRVANNTQYVLSPSNLKSSNHIDDAFFSVFDPDRLPTRGNILSKGWGLQICDIYTEDIFQWVFQNRDGFYWRDPTLSLENKAVSQLERQWCAGSGIAETNTSCNLKGGPRRRKFKKSVDDKFKRSVFRISTAAIPWEANYQLGGTAIVWLLRS